MTAVNYIWKAINNLHCKYLNLFLFRKSVSFGSNGDNSSLRGTLPRTTANNKVTREK